MSAKYALLTLFAAANALAAQPLPGLRSPAGAVYRVVNPEVRETANPYTVAPMEVSDPLPVKDVRLNITKPMTFSEVVGMILVDTNIAVAFAGDAGQQAAQRQVTSLKLSGQLRGVLDSASQAIGIQYTYRDGVIRFHVGKPFVLAYQDAEETDYLADLIKRDGGSVMKAIGERREIYFTGDYAAYRKVQADLQNLQTLKREPSRQMASRLTLAPVQSAPAAKQEAATPAQVFVPVVKVADGKATIAWQQGEAAELVRQLAAAANANFGGIEGAPRPVPITVNVTDKPLMEALKAVGEAMGDKADLVVRGKQYLVKFRKAP